MRGILRAARDLAFWPVAALAVALSGWLLLAAAGVAPVRPAELAGAAAGREPARAAAAPAPVRAPGTTVATTRRTPPPAQRVTVTVTATRGDSWIAARTGSASGRLLEERLLPQGETARLTAPRVWLLVGASANVDVRVNGEPAALAPGTVETVFAPPVR
jgi:cytoskeleton protein RodZ